MTAILHNEVYIGNLIQNRYHSISYKSKIKKPVPKNEWIRAENTHEPIIDKEIFRAVQNLSAGRTKSNVIKRTGGNVFSGKIFCGKCGSALRTSVCNHKLYLRCGRKLYDRNICEGTYVLYDRILSEVLSQMRKLTAEFSDIGIIKANTVFHDAAENSLQSVRKSIDEAKRQLKDTQNCIKKLYIDNVKEDITSEMYSRLMKEFAADEARLSGILEELQNKKISIEYAIRNRADSSEIIQKYLELDSLGFEMVRSFIDRIVVHKDTGKSRSFTLEIFWNF